MSNPTKLDEVRRKVENLWVAERNKEVDIFRDTAVRYCGYSNEVGESFRPLIPRSIVHFSYVIAIVYVIGDCVDKTVKTYQVSGQEGPGTIHTFSNVNYVTETRSHRRKANCSGSENRWRRISLANVCICNRSGCGHQPHHMGRRKIVQQHQSERSGP